MVTNTLTQKQKCLLERWAARYIWWKQPADALHYPERIIAQVMDIGDYDDVLEMLQGFGEDTPREVLGMRRLACSRPVHGHTGITA